MIKMYANKFAGILDNMGFFVRNTTVMSGVDDHTTLSDSFTATIDTENGLFEMVVTDGFIVANKPNGTQKYWGDLTEARALAYIRQVLEFNHPVFHDEPEAEEVPEANVEEAEPEVADVDEDTVRRTVDYVVRTYPRKLDRDLDAINEGWDAFNCPDDGYVYQWALAMLESGLGDGKRLPDEAMDWLADACYGVLCPTEEAEPEDHETVTATVTLQQAYVDSDGETEALLDRVWDACEALDPHCEWGDQTVADVVEALRGTFPGLARQLADVTVPAFAELTPEQEALIEGLGVGPVFVTPDQEEAVDRGLGLRDLDREGMRAVRNSVVRHLAPLATQAREAGDWDLFDQLHANMSGICAVIDLRMAS